MKEPYYPTLQKHVLSHRIFESELHGIKLDPNKMATAFGARIAQKSLDANVKPERFREWLEENQNTFRQPQPFRHSEQP